MFNPSVAHLENVFLTRHLVEWLIEQKLTGDVVVSPDVGYLERARAYAEELSADLAALSKERDYSKPNQVFRSTLIGDVKNKNVLLVDDIVDSAGSVVAAVNELKEHGALDIVVACSHPILSDPAWKRLSDLHTRAKNEGWRFSFVGTSTVEHEKTPGLVLQLWNREAHWHNHPKNQFSRKCCQGTQGQRVKKFRHLLSAFDQYLLNTLFSNKRRPLHEINE